MSAAPFAYQGSELELFAHARRWKAYWVDVIRPWIHGDVLEVGAGMGANTPLLRGCSPGGWACLEPDAAMLARARESHAADALGGPCEYLCGTLETLERGRRFDAIVYLDVLEHIEDDRGELARAAERLRPGGHLVVLAPAHQRLYTEFDRAIGHFRRYAAGQLLAQLDPWLAVVDHGPLFPTLVAPRAAGVALERLRARFVAAPAEPAHAHHGVGEWHHGTTTTRIVSGLLAADTAATRRLGRFGRRLTGLSHWAYGLTR